MRRATRNGLSAVLVMFAGLVAPVPSLGGAAVAAASSAPALEWSHTYSGWNRSSSPTLADVNGDGRIEVVHGHQDGQLRVLDARTGQNIAGWPQPAGAAIDSTPAVADLDGDSRPEIVVGVGSTWVPNQNGGLVVFRNDGSVRCRYQSMDFGNIWANSPGPDGFGEGVYSSPAIGDVNGDGGVDIVFGGFDHHIHALDANCNELAGFPYNVEDSTWSSPALYDVDKDGRKEIFVGSDQSPGGSIDWAGGEFRALDWRAGGVVELWRQRVGDVFSSSPAIGDITGDGRMEVVTGAGSYFGHPDGNNVYAYDLATGSPLAGWPVRTGGPTFSSPAIGDVDRDGVDDVVIGSRDGSVRAIGGGGGVKWSRGLRFLDGPGHAVNASPIIADLDGDGRNEVGVGNDWAFFVLDGASGSEERVLEQWTSFETAAAVGNVEGRGWHIFLSSIDTPNHTTRVAAYSIPGPGGFPEWPMFRKRADHLGGPAGKQYPPVPPGQCASPSNPKPQPVESAAKGYYLLSVDGTVRAFGVAHFGDLASRGIAVRARALATTPSGKGYWIVGEDGSVHTFGDATYHGSMAGVPLNGPIQALETTPSGNGYWLLGSDGGVFSFGDAAFWGSTGALALNAPVVSMKSTPTGKGYWLLALDGGVFTFGDARFHGSTGDMVLAAPVISMAVHPHTGQYWLFGADAGVFSFGVPFYGSVPGLGLCSAPQGVQIRPTGTGEGYYIAAASGEVFSFGDAPFRGSAPGRSLADYVVDMAVVD